MRVLQAFSVWVLLFQVVIIQTVEARDGLYFPPDKGAWEEISASEAGLNTDNLERALNYAQKQKSSSVVILFNGRLVAERNWKMPADGKFASMVVGKTDDGRHIEDVASVQKSVVSILCGIAQGKGLIEFDTPAYRLLGKGWSKAPAEAEQAITLRHLLTMSSGLTTALEYEKPAGEKWMYNTQVYSKLHRALEVVSGLEFNALTKDWLTGPLGMQESRWAPRKRSGGAGVNARGFATTARDLARFGLFVLAEGNWRGNDVLGNHGYLQTALTPSQALNRRYGFLWWLNTNQADVPAGPADLVMAKGAGIRRIYVTPSLGLVVTRIGNLAEKDFDKKFWALLLGK